VARIPLLLSERVEPEDIPLDIIYEDDWLIVVNKPSDMVVHPAKGHRTGTLVNAVAWHCRQLSLRGGELRAGIVHRLDRDTTGVILLIKDERVHERIARQFEHRQVKKQYIAICEGVPELDGDVIDAPIGPHPRQVERMAVRHDVGKAARTRYEVVERLAGFAVVRCFPETGRTHQIRVHLLHVGHPIVCDSAYGRRECIYPSDLTGGKSDPSQQPLLTRQALHARRLSLHHPALDRDICFEAPVPDDMMALIEALRAGKQGGQGSGGTGR
jgi:23S rRNA pseudouridine1911/1915/1917 synthase